MNKKLFPIFAVFILVMILISTWPYILESRMPVNQFIASQKKTGVIPVVQFVTDDMQIKIADDAASKYNAQAPTKVIVKSFKLSENQESAEKYGMNAPGFVVVDGDGKVTAQEFGVISDQKLAEIAPSVHMH